MDWLGQLDVEKLLLFALILMRVSGVVVVAPVFGTPEVPAQVRALLAVALAAVVTPGQWHVAVDYPVSVVNLLVFAGAELAVGVCLGLGVVILLSGVHLAGQIIGRTSGLMMADIFDPTSGESTSVFGHLLHMLALAVFLLIGGHRILLAGLLDTFAALPPGAANLPLGVGHALVVLLTQSFALGIRVAAPVVAAVLLSTLILGLISRTMPQLNILAVGFGLNSMLALGTMALALGGCLWVFEGHIEPAVSVLFESLDIPPPDRWL